LTEELGISFADSSELTGFDWDPVEQKTFPSGPARRPWAGPGRRSGPTARRTFWRASRPWSPPLSPGRRKLPEGLSGRNGTSKRFWVCHPEPLR